MRCCAMQCGARMRVELFLASLCAVLAIASCWPLKDALSHCQQFDDLYQGIKLGPWQQHGIDRSTMAQSIYTYTTRGLNKGIALAFVNGTAYVVEAKVDKTMGHHANIVFTYMQVILELEQLFGQLIPDVEFVIATSDRPMVRLNSTPPHLPVFRFCSSDVHADIQIPIFHFYTKRYTQAMLDTVAQVNQTYPWETKKEVLFGRFSNYLRYIVPNEPSLARLGTGGRNICRNDTPDTTSCRVRHHLVIWALRHPDLLDIKSSPRVPMSKHAAYKYLLHIDGQALSSRLDLLLPLNSLVMKEESGYTAFYHHLLKPKVHYIPVWKKTPDDMLAALEWAQQNDAEARQIAANGQAFALKYLNKRTRTCYWFRLLTEFSKLLKYKVSSAHELAEAAEKQARKSKRPPGDQAGIDAAVARGGPCASVALQQTSQGDVVKGDARTSDVLSETRLGQPGELGCWMKVRDYLDTVAQSFEGGRFHSPRIEEF